MFATPGGFVSGDTYRMHDWLIAASHDAMARETLLVHRQIPIRSHLVGGGFPVGAHPSDGAYSPFIIPSLLFGERIGLRVNLILTLFLGSVGVLLLCRERIVLSLASSLFAASAFAVSGWHASRVLVGFYESTFFMLFPLMLYLIITAHRSSVRFFAAVIVTLTCFMQALAGAAVFLLFLAAHLAAHTAGGHGGLRRLPAMRLAVLVLLSTLFLGAVKFAPMSTLLTSASGTRGLPASLAEGVPYGPMERFVFRRTSRFYDTLSVWLVTQPDAYYGSFGDLARRLTSHVPRETEYTEIENDGRLVPRDDEYPHLGLGGIVVALAALGTFGRRREALANFGILAFFALICMGPNAPVDIWRLVFTIPVINTITRPVQYFNVVIVMQMCLLAGFGYAFAEERLFRGTKPRALFAGACALLLVPGALAASLRYYQAFSVPLPVPEREPEFYQVMLDEPRYREEVSLGYANTYLNIKRGIGTIVWDSWVNLPAAARPKYFVTRQGERYPAPRYRGEAWFSERDKAVHGNSVKSVRVTPNRIDLELDMVRPGRLVINQNFNTGWKATAGRTFSRNGRLAVRLDKPVETLTLRFRSRSFGFGATVSIATWVALIGFHAIGARRWPIYFR